jgi:two-component system LytT family response regulator
MRLGVFVAEDEPLARRALVALVAEVEWLECLGEAGDGVEAVRAIDVLAPALVFLDVHMPGLDGLEVVRRIRCAPEVVFTTAYDRYAVAAFEIGAIDYLVKPFGRERFARALGRVRSRVRREGEPSTIERARDALAAAPLRRLFTRRAGAVVPVALGDVVRLEARGDYVAIHEARGASLMHVTLSELEARLDPERFFRVHRSHLVNLDHVSAIRAQDDRRFLVVLDDGTELVASRAGSLRLRERWR